MIGWLIVESGAETAGLLLSNSWLVRIMLFAGKLSGKENKPLGKSGGGWLPWMLKPFVPNKKNQAHLPDDKNPTVGFS